MKASAGLADYHTHCGQYYDVFFDPKSIIEVMSANGIREAWISSTTSCVTWKTQKEKKELIEWIDHEIDVACMTAQKHGMDLTPLYWVLPKRHSEGESISDVMNGSRYRGFKIHPALKEWNSGAYETEKLFDEICQYASGKNMPVLIHTGEDSEVRPERFEPYFEKYSSVSFYLAHCKEASRIIHLFKKHENVFGDTAFCPEDSFLSICRAGYGNRMHMGTDFPITSWYEYAFEENKEKEGNLSHDYTRLLNSLRTMISKCEDLCSECYSSLK